MTPSARTRRPPTSTETAASDLTAAACTKLLLSRAKEKVRAIFYVAAGGAV